MKLLITNPDFYKSALSFDYKQRTWSNLIVASKFLKMFESQPGSCFGAPTYKAWYGLNNEFKEALKLYYNCLLKVCKEIYGYKTKYEYYSIDVDKLVFPNFTDLTFKSHQAFLIHLDNNLYISKFGKEIQNFNSGFCIWEYPVEKNGEIINVCEDFNGIYKPNILEDKIEQEVKSYNLMEINKNNLSIC